MADVNTEKEVETKRNENCIHATERQKENHSKEKPTWCIVISNDKRWNCPHTVSERFNFEVRLNDLAPLPVLKRLSVSTWGGSRTSCPRSMAHSLADWALASTITLNMVQMDCGTRNSVARLLLWSLASNAARVLQRGREDFRILRPWVSPQTPTRLN